MSLPKENILKQKPITMVDVFNAFITIIIGFAIITFVPKDIPNPALFYTIGFMLGISGPVLFLIKFFRQPIKLDNTSQKSSMENNE